MASTERDDAPWTWTGWRFENHYSHPVSGSPPEEMEHAAALDWAQYGNPQDGDRWGEFFIRDGQLWNDGKYSAADGSAEPYVVGPASVFDADAAAACAAARAAAEAGAVGDEAGDDEAAGTSADQDIAAESDADGEL